MALFPMVYTDKKVTICDKFRIDATKSFLAKPDVYADVKTVEIDPGDGNGFVFVKTEGGSEPISDWYLDWSYTTDGTFSIVVRMEAIDGRIVTKSVNIDSLLEADDCLWACDQDLELQEHEIRCHLPKYRSSFNFIHRRAAVRILEWLDEQKYKTCDGKKLTKDNVIVTEELREWATYQALVLIFENEIRTPDDIFSEKAKLYFDKMNAARYKCLRGIDWNNDGEIDGCEEQGVDTTCTISVRTR